MSSKSSSSSNNLRRLRALSRTQRGLSGGEEPAAARGALARDGSTNDPPSVSIPILSRWRRIGLGMAGVHGAVGVAAGAVAAHGQILLVDMVETGARYQVLHAAALLAASLAPVNVSPRILVLAGLLWSIGATVFSGGLYLKAAGEAEELWRLIPAGGMAMILGWVTIALIAALRPKP